MQVQFDGHEAISQCPPKFGRAETVLAHFEDIGVANPDSIATDRYLNILGGGWRRDILDDDSGTSNEVLIRPLPQSIEPYEEDSYLADFEERGGDMRVTSNGLEIRAKRLGTDELRAALELERACSLELAAVEKQEPRLGAEADEVLSKIDELNLDESAQEFLALLTPGIMRVVAYMNLSRNEIADKFGVRPRTVKAYLYEARKAGNFETAAELLEFLQVKGLLLDNS